MQRQKIITRQVGNVKRCLLLTLLAFHVLFDRPESQVEISGLGLPFDPSVKAVNRFYPSGQHGTRFLPDAGTVKSIGGSNSAANVLLASVTMTKGGHCRYWLWPLSLKIREKWIRLIRFF